MQQEPKVNIFILHFGSPVETFNCLESSLNLNYSNFNIVLIDNDPSQILKTEFSKKYDVEYLNQDFVSLKQKKVFIVNTGENLGFSGGFNFGIDKMKKYGRSDFAWLLNNDLVCEKNSLVNLIQFSKENKNHSIIGSCIEIDKENRTFYGANLNLITGDDKPVMLSNNNTKNCLELNQQKRWLFAINGAAIFINLNLNTDRNILPTKYFLFFEEFYLAEKNKQKSLKIITCLSSTVYHQSSVNTSKNSKFLIYYIFRNRLAFFLEFYPQYFILIFLYQSIRVGGGYFKQFKFKEFVWVLQAIIDAPLTRFSIKPFFGK
jgi:GT2 family glycosyltransferase